MAIKNKKRYAVDPMSGAAPSIGFTTKKVTGQSEIENAEITDKARLQIPREKTNKALSFEFNIPKVTLPKVKYSRRAAVFTALAGTALVISGIIFGFINSNKPQSIEVNEIKTVQTAPTFETLAPAGSKNTKKVVAFDEEKKVASYNDKISDIDVTISQQPLPDNFKPNPNEGVEELAASFKATNVITADKIKAFSGLSPETGTQTIVFAKNDLLIFILASKELTSSSIAQYIIGLK